LRKGGLKRGTGVEGLSVAGQVAEMAAGCCFDETREVMQDELYRAIHATDVRMVKVNKLAEQLDAAYPV
jgi:hypothetical protein